MGAPYYLLYFPRAVEANKNDAGEGDKAGDVRRLNSTEIRLLHYQRRLVLAYVVAGKHHI
jgi:hypothetical protein